METLSNVVSEVPARFMPGRPDHARGRSTLDEASARRSLTICEIALGPEHPDVAAAAATLATVLEEERRYDEVAPHFLRFWLLTNGVVRKKMPAWSKLPEPQRWQLVRFLKSGTSVPAAPPEPSTKR